MFDSSPLVILGIVLCVLVMGLLFCNTVVVFFQKRRAPQDLPTAIPLQRIHATVPVQNGMGIEDSGIGGDPLPTVPAPAYVPRPPAYTP